MSDSDYCMNELSNGKLNNESIVIRIIKNKFITMDGLIGPDAFILSGDDQKDVQNDRPHLSVWSKNETSPEQARGFLFDSTEYNYWAELVVSNIRLIRPDPDLPEIDSLDVLWFKYRPDPRRPIGDANAPGASGHAGIIGLYRKPGLSKVCFTDLRAKLTKLANEAMYTFTQT